MKLKRTLIFCFCLSLSFNLFSQNKINRIEPPNWWVGMKNTTLQLLIYGDQIGDFNPEINYAGITITQITKVPNPNYLFLDLQIAPETKAGDVKIDFKKDGKIVESHSYPLWERDAGSAEREGFNNSDVMYLITPDRFANGDASNDAVAGLREAPNRTNKGGRHGGDIQGIRDHLDYIKDLGFTAIWLNPVLENDMETYSYHGYSTTDYYKIDSRFGSNESYRTFCKESKDAGIKMIMDIIVNHCGSFHWWMDDLPTKDWVNFSEEPYVGTNHRKTVIQDPHVAKVDYQTMVDGWFVKTMPDLNQRNPLLATYLIQNSIWWIEYSYLAGIRMDTYPYPHQWFMTDWTKAIMEEYPDFNIVGEEWNSNPAIVAYWQRGKQNPNGYTSDLRSLMDFPVQLACREALTQKEAWGDGWIGLYEMIANDFQYADPDNLVIFPDNHDMMRFYSQINEDFDLFKLGIVFYATTRGIPQFYYGTEILMTSTDDHGIVRTDFPGGWPGDKVNARTGAGLSNKQKETQAFFKKILQWRKDKTAIHTGKLIHFEPKDGIYVYFRYNDTNKIMVVLNKGKQKNLELARFEELLHDVKGGKEVLTETKYSMQGSLEVPANGPMIIELELK